MATADRRTSRTSTVLDPAAVPADHIRLLTKVARLYHERGVRQPEIAARLNISQPRVSRLLKEATRLGIVRTTVVTPRGVHTELEEEIERRYRVNEVVVADTGEHDSEQEILPALSAAAAHYLETTLTGGPSVERIGISSWSSTLLATIEAMRPRPGRVAEQVVQVLGGFGAESAQAHATRLAGRLAQLTGASAVYLPAPGLVGSAATREAIVGDPHLASIMQAYDSLTTVLVGIGSLEPSPLLQQSGNAMAEADQEELRRLGAVGDVCLRFFDEEGEHVASELDDRIIGISIESLLAVPRRVGIAGGLRKFSAIRAALRGGWVNVLITDLQIAERLAADD